MSRLLVFGGMGIGGPGNLTLSLIDAAKQADFIFAEQYTDPEDISTIQAVEAASGKKAVLLRRRDLEDQAGREVLQAASKGNALLLVFGDPFIFTTHLALKKQAERLGIGVKVIHGLSVISLAPSCAGLDPYRFGPPVTVVYPNERLGYFPSTPYEVVSDNLSRDLHTLLLLDVVHDENRFMSFGEAIHILEKLEERMGRGVFVRGRALVLLSALGSDKERVEWIRMGQEVDESKFSLPKSIVVPATPRFYEAAPEGW